MTTNTDMANTHLATAAANRTSLLQAASTFAAVSFSGLFAGFLITVLVLEISLRNYGAAVYTQVRLVELEHLDDLATALLPASILASLALTLTIIRRPSSGRWLGLTAVLLLLATLVISVSISVPINTEQHNWSVLAPPGDWSAVRDRWQLAHVARTSTAALAFVLLTAIAVPLRRPGAQSRSGRSDTDDHAMSVVPQGR
jgi:hypothetical protein